MAKAKSRICCDQDSVYDFFMKAKQEYDILIRKSHKNNTEIRLLYRNPIGKPLDKEYVYIYIYML